MGAEDKLEQVRVFEKDAKQPKEVAFPDPSRDVRRMPPVGKLWSEETENRGGEKLRQATSASSPARSRATISWRTPRRIEPVRDHNDPEALAPGAESEEFQRILRIEAEKPSVKYKSLKDIPDSRAERKRGRPTRPRQHPSLLPGVPRGRVPLNLSCPRHGPRDYRQTLISPPSARCCRVQQQAATYNRRRPPAATPTARRVRPTTATTAANARSAAPYVPGTVNLRNNRANPPCVRPTRPRATRLNVGGKTYRGVCAFFNTPRGCNWGDKCGYLHEIGRNPT